MDISRQPPSANNSSNLTSSTASRNSADTRPTVSTENNLIQIPLNDISKLNVKVVSVSEAQLPIDAELKAIVAAQIQGNKLILKSDSALSKNVDISASQTPMQAPTDGLSSNPTKQVITDTETGQLRASWLLQIADKFILVNSKNALVLGEQLAVKISSDGTLNAITVGSSAPPENDLIRQTLARLLPQQVSARTGIDLIEVLLSKLNDTLGEKPSVKKSENLVNSLSQAAIISKFIKSQLPLQTNLQNVLLSDDTISQQANLSSNIVKEWLQKSGIQLESSFKEIYNTQPNAILTNQPQAAAKPTFDDNPNFLLPRASSALEQSALLARIFSKISLVVKEEPQNIAQWVDSSNKLLNLAALKDTVAQLQKMITAKTVNAEQSLLTPQISKALGNNASAFLTQLRELETFFPQPIKQNNTIKPSISVTKLINSVSQMEAALNNLRELMIPLSSALSKASSTATQASNITNGQDAQRINSLAVALLSPPKNDLKQVLLASMAGLKASENNASLATTGTTTTQVKTKGLAEESLFQKPFEFPRPELSTATNDNISLAKAQSILADQELTTGLLLRIMAGMLNRIQFNQANSLYLTQTSPETTLLQTWNIELPYLHEGQNSSIELKLEQHHHRDSQKDSKNKTKTSVWNIKLKFDLDELGTIFIEAELNPPSVKTNIWADKADTVNLIRNEQQFFKNRLQQIGIEIEEFACSVGHPPADSNDIKRGLVDTHA